MASATLILPTDAGLEAMLTPVELLALTDGTAGTSASSQFELIGYMLTV